MTSLSRLHRAKQGPQVSRGLADIKNIASWVLGAKNKWFPVVLALLLQLCGSRARRTVLALLLVHLKRLEPSTPVDDLVSTTPTSPPGPVWETVRVEELKTGSDGRAAPKPKMLRLLPASNERTGCMKPRGFVVVLFHLLLGQDDKFPSCMQCLNWLYFYLGSLLPSSVSLVWTPALRVRVRRLQADLLVHMRENKPFWGKTPATASDTDAQFLDDNCVSPVTVQRCGFGSRRTVSSLFCRLLYCPPCRWRANEYIPAALHTSRGGFVLLCPHPRSAARLCLILLSAVLRYCGPLLSLGCLETFSFFSTFPQTPLRRPYHDTDWSLRPERQF